MPVKVTHVVRQYLPSIGGMEEVVRSIALHQVRNGYKGTRIVTLDRLFRNQQERLPAREIRDSIEIVRLPYSGSSRYPICPKVLGALGDADLVHVHGVDFFYDFLAATKFIHHKPLLLSTHGGFFHTEFASTAKKAWFNSISRLSALAYNKVVATSANDGDLFRQIVKEPKLEVIENGVDVDKFANAGAQELLPTLIYFGRWSVNKGLLDALDFFAQLCARSVRWRFIIAGREYDLDETDLRERIDTLGLQGRVTVAPNPSDEEIRRLLSQSSYFLCLSRHEGFGIAPIEAMSAGLTPILSDIPPFQKLVDSTGLGFTLPLSGNNTGSAAARWADAITQLLNLHSHGNTHYLERRKNAMSAATSYAWPKVADRYLALYEEVAGGRQASGGSYEKPVDAN